MGSRSARTRSATAGPSPLAQPGPPAPDEVRGRGAAWNPANRFERLAYVADPEFVAWRAAGGDADAGEETSSPQTVLLRDPSRTAITFNQSPDVGFDASLNPYRGCEHGCIYCYARPTHEYLGFSAGLDFETRILVKPDAPELLRRELSAPRWMPQTVAVSGVTDPYQPIERQLGITRRCLAVFAEFRNPVIVVTKSRLVTRDLDLLAELARRRAAAVFVSVTTLDRDLHRIMEPRASLPAGRLDAIAALSAAGIPTGVMVAPVIPGLTDHEIPAILEAAAHAGASRAAHVLLRLPHAVAPLFQGWLDLHFPERKDKVLARIRSLRNGRLNDPRFRTRMRGTGPYADQLHALFDVACRRAGLDSRRAVLSTAAFRRPTHGQLALL